MEIYKYKDKSKHPANYYFVFDISILVKRT